MICVHLFFLVSFKVFNFCYQIDIVSDHWRLKFEMAVVTASSAGPSYAPEDHTLPKPWKGLVDGTTGFIYFWNPETNDTQYERPVPSSHVVSAPAHKSSVFVSSSVEKPSQGQHYDPDGGPNSGSNNKIARSSSDHFHDGTSVHEGCGSLGVGSDISQESYCRRNEISVTGGDVPAPLTSFEATGFPTEIVRRCIKLGFRLLLQYRHNPGPLPFRAVI